MSLKRQPLRPNVLLFLTDDHPGWALGCAGEAEIASPNIDFLARNGVRFANATTPCPVCSPARASLWTGTIPSWHGVHDHLNGKAHPGIGDQSTLTDAARAAGYRTAQIGKWHCHTSEDNSRRRGFDRWFSHYSGTRSRFGEQPFWDQDQRVDRYGYQAPFITEAARAFLREAAAEAMPFFCAVGYTETHSPFIDAPPRIRERYNIATFPSVPDEELPEVHGRVVKGLRKNSPGGMEMLRQFASAVTFVDEQVGILLDEIESLGLREQTLVLYTADHGQCLGNHGIAVKGNGTVPQNFFDESLDVPLIASLPGVIDSGRVIADPVDHLDTFATLLQVIDAAPPDPSPRPGRSWLGRASQNENGNAGDPGKQHVFAEYGNARMIRTPELKLIRRWPGPNGRYPDELYNRKTDPRETRNLIHDPNYADAAAALDRVMDDYFSQNSRPAADGRRVGELPLHNEKEPWRVAP